MKKLVCLGFMALVLGAQAGINDPNPYSFATVTKTCVEKTDCSYGKISVRTGTQQTCASGSQLSCTASACGDWDPWVELSC
jgi:hypothetical protein